MTLVAYFKWCILLKIARIQQYCNDFLISYYNLISFWNNRSILFGWTPILPLLFSWRKKGRKMNWCKDQPKRTDLSMENALKYLTILYLLYTIHKFISIISVISILLGHLRVEIGLHNHKSQSGSEYILKKLSTGVNCILSNHSAITIVIWLFELNNITDYYC